MKAETRWGLAAAGMVAGVGWLLLSRTCGSSTATLEPSVAFPVAPALAPAPDAALPEIAVVSPPIPVEAAPAVAASAPAAAETAPRTPRLKKSKAETTEASATRPDPEVDAPSPDAAAAAPDATAPADSGEPSDSGTPPDSGEPAEPAPPPPAVPNAPFEVVFREEVPWFKPTSIELLVDGKRLALKESKEGIPAKVAVPLYSGKLLSGRHTVQIRIRLVGDSALFSYLEGYHFTMARAMEFGADESSVTKVAITAVEQGNFTYEWKDRVALQIDVQKR